MSQKDYYTYYPNDFYSSRLRFISEAERLGASLTTLPIETSSPLDSETLSIDIALLGDPSSKPTLLYISGTHGIEGFIGSAIQHAIVSQLTEPPKDYALALIHCLNPWGMAYLRRTNEHNIDLNRNCTPTDDERTGAPPGYENLRSILMPNSALSFPLFCLQTGAAVIRHGFPTAKQAVTGGQYVDQHGLFYGGRTLQQELSLVRSWAATHLTDSSRVLVVDIHSGLGPFGQDTLIIDHYEGSQEARRIAALFPGYSIHGPDPRRSLAYNTRGSLSGLLPSILPHTTVDYVVHEFGTFHAFRVLHALVQENYYHFSSQSAPNLKIRHNIATPLLKEAFLPSSNPWRANALLKGLHIFNTATAHICDAN